MAAILKLWRAIVFSIYVKHSPVIFHPDPIRNDGALGFLKRSPEQEEEQQQQQQQQQQDE